MRLFPLSVATLALAGAMSLPAAASARATPPLARGTVRDLPCATGTVAGPMGALIEEEPPITDNRSKAASRA